MIKLTENELNELKYHYVDRIVDNMSTKDLVQYVFDDMLRYVETQFRHAGGSIYVCWRLVCACWYSIWVYLNSI